MIDVQTYECRHGTMAHFAADQCIGMSLREYGEWGEDEIALLARYVAPGATVLDVGANVGTHSMAFARLVGPAGRVIAEDHAGDEWRYACMSRPFVRVPLARTTSVPDVGYAPFRSAVPDDWKLY